MMMINNDDDDDVNDDKDDNHDNVSIHPYTAAVPSTATHLVTKIPTSQRVHLPLKSRPSPPSWDARCPPRVPRVTGSRVGHIPMRDFAQPLEIDTHRKARVPLPLEIDNPGALRVTQNCQVRAVRARQNGGVMGR